MSKTMKALPDGSFIDLAHPRDYVFRADQIAKLLSTVKRFNGIGISVALHSVNVAKTLFDWTGNPHIAIRGLFHDAHEAYIGDMATPVKAVAGVEWEKLEASLQTAIEQSLNIVNERNLVSAELIKLADLMSLKYELQSLVDVGLYSYGTHGLWEDLAYFNFKVPLLALEGSSPGWDLVAFQNTLERLRNESKKDIDFVEETFTGAHGKSTCLVNRDYLARFTNIFQPTQEETK